MSGMATYNTKCSSRAGDNKATFKVVGAVPSTQRAAFVGSSARVVRQTLAAQVPAAARNFTVKAVASVPATTDKIKIGINGTPGR